MKNRVEATIRLDRIAHNYNYIKSLAKGARVMAVIKANAYGHGSTELGKELSKIGCADFAVASIGEAQELRAAGLGGNILILGPTDKGMIKGVIDGDFIQTVDSLEYARSIAEKGIVRVHIKVDTGMSRLGIYCHHDDDVAAAAEQIKSISELTGIKIDGIFTHFADSDGSDSDFTNRQFSAFKKLLDELKKQGVDVGTRHCCNSAAILRYPEMHLDMVRAGIILYGLMPSKNVTDDNLLFSMKLSARVCSVHELKKGDCVSYGCTYRAEKDTKIAVLSIGYADGFSRVYSGKIGAYINNKYYLTVGKICMDMCMVELDDDAICNVGDEAIIFETRKDVDRLADTLGTINYEIVCSLKSRVTMQYE